MTILIDGERLTLADVERVVAQAVAEADAQNRSATIAVVDRVGNVFAVYRMSSVAPQDVLIASAVDGAGDAVIDGGLEGIRLPVPAAPVAIDDQAAIAKAVTAA